MTTTVRSADGRVVVPARLRRRRAEIRRDHGRKRLRRLIALGVLVAVGAAAWGALRSPLLDVDEITVTGSDHVDGAAALRATGLSKGTAMMDVSPAEATERLEALPWIASASVSREWPNRVEIDLVDRTPVAQIASGDDYALVDTTGRVLEDGGDRRDDLPVLIGARAAKPGSAVRNADALLATASSVPETERKRIVDIGLADDGAIAVGVREGGTVTLGRSEGFDAKFASLTTMLEHLGDLAEGCTLDVSVPTAPTLTPEYGCV